MANNMEGPLNVKAIFAPYAQSIDQELLTLFEQQPDYKMYGMQRYFMGFADEKFQPLSTYGGKRFRSGLALLVADMYGVKAETLDIAVTIELFHNFTLIHDDIEDNDELRRGRPTVWKLWGVPQAINAGDAQLIMVSEVMIRGCQKLGQSGYRLQQILLGRFREVTEGQYLDFTLTEAALDDPLVNEVNYFSMLGKKTSVLVGVATQAPGIVATLPEPEQQALWEYGYALGVAYQLCDDCMSIWGEGATTGKDLLGDLKEKKKTLPILLARDHLPVADQKRLVHLYGKTEALTEEEAREVKTLLDTTSVHDQVCERIDQYRGQAKQALTKLTLSNTQRATLDAVLEALLPETRR